MKLKNLDILFRSSIAIWGLNGNVFPLIAPIKLPNGVEQTECYLRNLSTFFGITYSSTYSFTNNDITTYHQNSSPSWSINFYFGESDVQPTYEDYKLLGNIDRNNFKVLGSDVTPEYKDNSVIFHYVSQFLAKSSLTIKEIGMGGFTQEKSSGGMNGVLLTRDVIETPFEVNTDDSFTVKADIVLPFNGDIETNVSV